MNIKTNIRTATALAVACSVLLAVCSCKPEAQQRAEGKAEYTPKGEFVRITDRNGNVYMFRPHMVTQIISETNGCHIDVAGIGAIPMACSIDEAAKLVKDR